MVRGTFLGSCYLGVRISESRTFVATAHNPFSETPPKFIRADWYRYRFTKPGERGWWTRTFVGEYLPAVTLPRTPDAVRE